MENFLVGKKSRNVKRYGFGVRFAIMGDFFTPEQMRFWFFDFGVWYWVWVSKKYVFFLDKNFLVFGFGVWYWCLVLGWGQQKNHQNLLVPLLSCQV